MTVRQVAAALQVHPNTVAKWIHDGKLKGSKLGNRYRITLESFDAFLNENSNG